MWSNRNSHSLSVGKGNGIATLKDSSAVSYLNILIIQSRNGALWRLPTGIENLCSHKNLYMDV